LVVGQQEDIGSLEYSEINAWNCFETVLRKYIEAKNLIKKAKNFDELEKSENNINKHNTLEILSIVPEESIDYVFTGPSYGGSVLYLELSFMIKSPQKRPSQIPIKPRLCMRI
jgi:hypothetical protein